jgi:hypothetical protein
VQALFKLLRAYLVMPRHLNSESARMLAPFLVLVSGVFLAGVFESLLADWAAGL